MISTIPKQLIKILVVLMALMMVMDTQSLCATKKKKKKIKVKNTVVEKKIVIPTKNVVPVVILPPPVPVAVEKPSLVLDDFEDGNYTQNPEWWKFDRLFLSVVQNTSEEKSASAFLANYSLLIEGSSSNWYVGGFGTYIGKDFSPYDAIQLVVWGSGPGSGMLKMELYDDDNANWEVDVDKAKGFDATSDDKFSNTMEVNWTGWKVVTIPLYDFEDENLNVGDDKWNPDQQNGSGGLLQMQVIVLTSGKAVGKVNVKVDSIKFIKR